MQREGQAFFAAKRASCHSASGDLKGLASRISDPKVLHRITWVAGRARMGTGRWRSGGEPGPATNPSP